nr:methyltransferase domain-containing protein [uncultured Ralstonia sp.]
MTQGALPCNVCQQPLPEPIYRAPQSALSSLRRAMEGTLEVFCCNACGHIQTVELCDNGSFYDTEYDILVNSEEEDQIYAVENGQKIFRADHQVATFQRKLALQGGLHEGARVVDFGCAKSATMRQLLQQRPDVNVHLFDISDRYVGFWEKFLSPGQWATYTIPPAWQRSFDVVSSFFSLEHIPDLTTALRNIHGLLRDGGLLYAIVPNTFTNSVDFLVADHVNHFTHTSLQTLLANHGFDLLEADAQSHRGAFVVTAVRRPGDSKIAPVLNAQELADTQRAANKLARFWQQASSHLTDFEAQHGSAPAVIYGAGFYGAYTASNLQQPHALRAFVDQNPYLQGSSLAGKPVVALDKIPDEVEVVYLAVNPVIADEVRHTVEAAYPNRFRYFRFQP